MRLRLFAISRTYRHLRIHEVKLGGSVEAQRFPGKKKIRVLYQEYFSPFQGPVSDADEDSIVNRRKFLSTTATAAALTLTKPVFGRKAPSSTLSYKERVDRALRGEDLDRPPFTFYHHYKRPTAQIEARDHLEFHRAYNTDIVKVMNDFDYPQSITEKWYELKPLESPFPEQLATLKLIRDGLNGDAYFIDTIYGPYMTAMILFQSQPQFASLGKSEEVQDEQIKSLHDSNNKIPMRGTVH